MALTFFTDGAEVREALNGLDVSTSASADAQLENRVEEEEAYIAAGWGAHPANQAANPTEWMLRRRATLLLVANFYNADYSARSRGLATANIGYNATTGG